MSELRNEISALALHPRCQPLLEYDEFTGDACVIDGPAEVLRMDALTEGLAGSLERLSDERLALREVRGVVKVYRRERDRISRRSYAYGEW